MTIAAAWLAAPITASLRAEIWGWLLGALVIAALVALAVVILVIVGVALVWFATAQLKGAADRVEALASRVTQLETQHRVLLARIGRKTPPGVAFTALAADWALLIADKAFGEDAGTALAVSAGLFALFAVANQCQEASNRWIAISGWVVWFGTIGLLPVYVMIFHGWSPRALWSHVQLLDTATGLALVISFLLLLTVPFIKLTIAKLD